MTEDTRSTQSLERSRNGATVHRADCGVPGTRRPWSWADGRPLEEVERIAIGNGITGCKICSPFRV